MSQHYLPVVTVALELKIFENIGASESGKTPAEIASELTLGERGTGERVAPTWIHSTTRLAVHFTVF